MRQTETRLRAGINHLQYGNGSAFSILQIIKSRTSDPVTIELCNAAMAALRFAHKNATEKTNGQAEERRREAG